MKQLLAALLALAPTAGAQHLLQQVLDPTPPPSNSTSFGRQVAFTGDLDQDGYDDFVATGSFGLALQGRLYAYSGRTGLGLWTFDGSAQDNLGQAGVAAVGDLSGDGVPEVLVSGSTMGVRILSGVNGAQLDVFDPHPGLPAEPEALGDVDGDGTDDYLATYSSDNLSGQPSFPGGRVYVVSGANQVPIRSHSGFFGAIYGANAVGDIDGDNVQDYAFWFGCGEYACSAGYELRSGATGALLHSDTGGFGQYPITRVVGVGDFDGDGTNDFHWFHETTPQVISPPTVVQNDFVSGATGTTLQSLSSTSPYRIYGSVGDRNGDGRDEILALYDQFPQRKRLVALDPATLTESWVAPGDLTRIYNPFFQPSLGGDVNGDGNLDVVVAVQSFLDAALPAGLPNRVLALSLVSPLATEEFCFGDGGTSTGCTDCPCTNNTLPGAGGGCTNSTGQGAQLRALGDVRLSDDQLEFQVYLAPQNTFALLSSAANPLPLQGPCVPGSGVTGVLLTGLRCAGGDFRRHGTRATDSAGNVGVTNAGWGASNGVSGNLLMEAGMVLGQSRTYQVFYRDMVLDALCGTPQSTTNAVLVTPTP